MEELLKLRRIDSDLEGHPTPRLAFVDVATGSLGQGICAAAGMAYAAKYIENSSVKIFCICGDGEMSEGSCWEALLFASKHKIDNLIVVIDMNRFGQSEEAPHAHNVEEMKAKVQAFGARAFVVDGHSTKNVAEALFKAKKVTGQPSVIIAKTMKGKYFPENIEDKPGWHGKPLEGEEAKKAIESIRTLISHEENKEESKLEPTKPDKLVAKETPVKLSPLKLNYKLGDKVATRNAYGTALKSLGEKCAKIVALDADTKNSTMAIGFAKAYGVRFAEAYIAEQNMVGAAVGMQTRGLIPFVSTFAAFHTRAFDFIRMAAISMANLKLVGSHAGVHIGQDGPSQMGLEDFAMMRAVPGSVVLYPSDAVSCEQAVVLAANFMGIVYIRTTRGATPVVYQNEETFEVGKCKVHRVGGAKIVVVAGGITFHEGKFRDSSNVCILALKAQKQLKDTLGVTVIDVFSIKPLDVEGIYAAAKESGGKILTVEDHYKEGGIYGTTDSK